MNGLRWTGKERNITPNGHCAVGGVFVSGKGGKAMMNAKSPVNVCRHSPQKSSVGVAVDPVQSKIVEKLYSDPYSYLWRTARNIAFEYDGVSEEDVAHEIVIRLLSMKNPIDVSRVNGLISHLGAVVSSSFREFHQSVEMYDESGDEIFSVHHHLSAEEKSKLDKIREAWEKLHPGEVFDPVWLTSGEAYRERIRIKKILFGKAWSWKNKKEVQK